MKYLHGGLLALALVAPGLVIADTLPAELTPEHFAQLDRNQDGKISMDEYEQFMRESFKKMDTNGDNHLSLAETQKVMSPQQFKETDRNGDGKISLDEFITQVMNDFYRYDTNKDGTLQP
jgi:Ca2+-binding EF-hand superfamily protein